MYELLNQLAIVLAFMGLLVNYYVTMGTPLQPIAGILVCMVAIDLLTGRYSE